MKKKPAINGEYEYFLTIYKLNTRQIKHIDEVNSRNHNPKYY